jgi:lipoate---protein ligase
LKRKQQVILQKPDAAMIFIRNDITDPYFNLAAEEYFLRNSTDEYFLVYINDPSVIIGKHQNAYAEINYPFIRNENIKVVRRISGGGAVWHDLGNLNFTFIKNGKEGEFVNFRKYMQPVLDFLLKLELDACFKGKNTMEANGYKVSGNAEHVYKNRVMHHGTLLFDTNITVLEEALNVNPQKYLDKSVKSVRASVANINEMLGSKMSFKEFRDAFVNHIISGDTEAKISDINSYDFRQIQLLTENKYSTWDWNFGYSPQYQLSNKTSIAGSDFIILIEVEKSRIIKVRISGSLFAPSLAQKIEQELLGVKHDEKTIEGVLAKFPQNAISEAISTAELALLFF